MTFSFSFEAIGTHWTIDIYQKLLPEQQDKIKQRVLDRIAVFDFHYSRFKENSLVSTMAQKAGEYELPLDAKPMFELYKTLYDLTDGQMTPLIGQLISDAGYDATYSFNEKSDLVSPPSWHEAIEYPLQGEYTKIFLKQPVLLDMGALGKGYLIDIVGEVLRNSHIKSFCVDAGGDILHIDEQSIQHNGEPQKFLKIGLENPLNISQIIGVAELYNKSLAGSAGNRRKWGRFHHIINPSTKSSPENILAVWVVADSTILADALTTALYFIPSEKLKAHFAFEYVIVYADTSLEKSEQFPGSFFNS